jgi:hypothetical protein
VGFPGVYMGMDIYKTRCNDLTGQFQNFALSFRPYIPSLSVKIDYNKKEKSFMLA